jgi:AcrR family transcriptional regulator/predicted DNA-binding transcriptional regulator AlpA
MGTETTDLDLSEVVAGTGVPAATLHHWLRLGLLPPPSRLARNRFAYDERHVQAGRLVRLLRERRRMPLRDIATILPALLEASAQEGFRPEMWDSVIGAQLRLLQPARPPAELVAAARTMFAQHGYAVVSVDDLCEAAGIAKGSFYRWFASKDDAYVKAVRSIGDCIEAELATRPAAAGVEVAEEALGRAARPYLALLLEAGSHTMRGGAAVGSALIDALDAMERAFVRVAGWRRPPSRRRLEDVLARVVSAAIDAAT